MADATTDDSLAPRRVSDPSALRALSHPLRLKLLAELAIKSPQNVTMLASAVGEPPNSVSYHLGQLVQHQLAQRVEAPEGATRRERWFAAASRTGFALEITDDTPDQTATLAAVRAWALQMAADEFDRMVANEPEARRRELPFGNAVTNVWLTRDEAAELRRRVDAVLRPLAEKLASQRDLVPDAEDGELVHYTVDVAFFPDFSRDPLRASFFTEGLDPHAGSD